MNMMAHRQLPPSAQEAAIARASGQLLSRYARSKAPLKLRVTDGEQASLVSVAGGMSVGMTYMQRLMMSEGVLDHSNTIVITPLAFLPMHEFAVRGHYQHPEKSPLLVDEYYFQL